MMIFSIVLLIFLLVLGIGWAASAQIMWQSWQLKDNIRYRILPNRDSAQLPDVCVVVVPHVNLATVIIIRYLTHLPIWTLFHDSIPNDLLRQTLRMNEVKFIHYKDITKWKMKGILLVAEYDYHSMARLIPKSIPLFLAYLCGVNQIDRRGLPKPTIQWLMASFIKVAPANEHQMRQSLQKLGVHAWMDYTKALPSLTEQWLYHAKKGGKRLSVADSTGVALTQHRFATAVLTLQQKLSKRLRAQHRIGICLPSSVAGYSAIMTLLAMGKTVVSLNYTASVNAILAAIVEAEISTVITSRQFMTNLENRGFKILDAFDGITIIYLEDIKVSMGKMRLFTNLLLVKCLPYTLLRGLMIAPTSAADVAVILFSSGSEGKPKGVELSYANLVGNAKQAAACMEVRNNDVMAGILPIFHAFGLTATTILPLMEGIPVICHFDPRDAETIGKLIAQYHITILCGTSTFLRLYVKSRHMTQEMLKTIRLIVAGAERLSPEVRSQFFEKFNKEILEGYGTTELSPVGAVNQPDLLNVNVRQKQGTVGRVIPGSMVRVVDPESLEDLPVGVAGLVMIAGINVMKGYLNNPEKTAESIVEDQGLRWYKTGDKGYLDKDGFLTIVDRYSRFAKIGGEMVSLSAVEAQIMQLLPDNTDVELLAVALADAKKGERIVLLFSGHMDKAALQKKIQHSAINNLSKPDEIILVEQIPKLGTGKTDFVNAKKVAEAASMK